MTDTVLTSQAVAELVRAHTFPRRDENFALASFARAVEAAVLAKMAGPQPCQLYIGAKDGALMLPFGYEPSMCPKCGQEPNWVRQMETVDGEERLRLHCRCGHIVRTLCADWTPKVVGTL